MKSCNHSAIALIVVFLLGVVLIPGHTQGQTATKNSPSKKDTEAFLKEKIGTSPPTVYGPNISISIVHEIDKYGVLTYLDFTTTVGDEVRGYSYQVSIRDLEASSIIAKIEPYNKNHFIIEATCSKNIPCVISRRCKSALYSELRTELREKIEEVKACITSDHIEKRLEKKLTINVDLDRNRAEKIAKALKHLIGLADEYEKKPKELF